MRIGVYLGDRPPDEGGGYTFQEDILRALMDMGESHDHTFVVYNALSKEQAAESERGNLRFERTRSGALGKRRTGMKIYFDRIALLGRILRMKSSFERKLKRDGVELMWFVTPTYADVDIPYVYTIWDLQHRLQSYFPEVSSNGIWELKDRYFRKAIQRSAKVIVCNEVGKQEVANFYQLPESRILMLPHPTPSFALNAQSVEGSSEVLKRYGIQGKYVFYPAQLWPHKNHVGLLEAMKLLRDTYGVEVTAVLAGADKGNLAHIMSIAKEYRLESQVRHVGFVPREDLIELYRNALALTYLTYFGPENLPPLEAFGLGCPVIASRVSGADEQLGDAAILVDPTNACQIAKAIDSIYRDASLRESLVEKGKVRAQDWTARGYVSAMLEYFDDFANIRRCWR